MIDQDFDIFTIKDNFKVYSHVDSILIKKSKVEHPEITFFVPTYKRVSTLRETLDSILNQDGDYKYEILLLDNNPERDDETELLVKREYASIPQLSYYKNSENIGMTGNWNRGYELARSEWVSMLHDDDCLFRNSIQYVLRIINLLDNSLDALFLNHVFCKSAYSNQKVGHIKKLSSFDFFMDNCGTVVGAFLKRQSVISLGGFTDALYPAADYHFWAKITKFKTAYRVIDVPRAFYRIGDNTSCNPAIINQMIDSASKIQRGILLSQYNNPIIKLIGYHKIKYWEYTYLFAWKNMFGNNKNVEDINNFISVAEANISLTSKVIGHFFNFIYSIYNRYRRVLTIQY